jgi:hypothetical protein
MHDGFQMQFCRDQRKTLIQVKTHLIAENGHRAGAGTVSFLFRDRARDA